MSGPAPGAAAAPAADRVNGRHFRALLRTQLRELSRGGTDLSTGVKGNPLVQITSALGIFGIFSAFGVLEADPIRSVQQIFAQTWLITMFLVLPDSLRSRDARREILTSRPVSYRTHSLVQVVLLFVLATLLAVSFAVWPLGTLLVRGGLDLLTFLAAMITIVASVFAVSTLWLALALRIGRRLGMDRLRSLAQLVQVLLMMVVVAPLWFGSHFSISPLITPWLPPTFFADIALGRPQPLQALLALAMVAGGVLIALRLKADVYYEAEASRIEKAGGKGIARRLLDAIHHLPWLGPRILPRETRAVADLILRVVGREEASRLRGVAAWSVASIGAMLYFFEPMMGAVLAVSGLGVAMIDGLAAASQSADAASSWLLHAVPIDPRHRVAGVGWAIAVRFTSLPIVLLACIAWSELPWPAATILSLALPVVSSCLVSIYQFFFPVRALGNPPAMGFFVGCVTMQLTVFTLTAMLGTLVALTYLGPFGLVLDGALVLIAAGVAVMATQGAAARLEGMELAAG